MNKKEIQKAWAMYCKDEANKPYKDKKYGNKIEGNIGPREHIIYNALRGVKLNRGFTNNTQYAKFDNIIKYFVLSTANYEKYLVKNGNLPYFLKVLLRPYNSLLTIEDIMQAMEKAIYEFKTS